MMVIQSSLISAAAAGISFRFSTCISWTIGTTILSTSGLAPWIQETYLKIEVCFALMGHNHVADFFFTFVLQCLKLLQNECHIFFQKLSLDCYLLKKKKISSLLSKLTSQQIKINVYSFFFLVNGKAKDGYWEMNGSTM